MNSQAHRYASIPISSQPRRGVVPTLSLVVSLALIGLVVPAAPALAATCDAPTFAGEFNGASGGSTVVLCGDLTIAAVDNLPLAVASGTDITLDLNGHMLDVTAPDDHAGIGVPEGAMLTITDSSSPSTGLLIATASTYSAGIGGSRANGNAGTIVVNGGTISAAGGDNGAGLGGGIHGIGTITINGGNVTATGDATCDPANFDLCSGAGIGGAGNGGVGTITINGGVVTATGNGMSAGIGGGGPSGGSNGGTITINGGDITATGGNDSNFGGAGIGSAGNRTAGPITITGGTVRAVGGHGPGGYAGAGIGSGAHTVGPTGDITISGGNVIATGGTSTSGGAAGIGGGSCSAGPIVTVSGSTTTVAAAGTGGGAGIGGGGCTLSDTVIDGGNVTVGAGSAVSVLSDTGTAIGGSNGGAFGSLSNTGTITLASPLLIPAGATVANDGVLLVSTSITNAGTITGTGTLSGTGTVDNAGAIWRTVAIGDDLTVLDHHYQLVFDTNGGSVSWDGASPWSIVDGPTLTAVGRTTAEFPTATRTGYDFTGWHLGTGGTALLVTDTTALPGASNDGTPVAVTLYAGWSDPTAPAHVRIVEGDGQTASAGDSFDDALSVSVTNAQDTPVAAGTLVTFTVTQGDASFLGSSSATVSTDATGIAAAPTLTAGSAAGPVTVEATVAGVTTPATFTETVTAAPVLTVTTTDLPDAEVGVPYNQSLTATGAADGIYHWTLASGTLPDGLHLSDAGVIDGTPTAAGTFAFTVSVNDPAVADLTITVAPAAVVVPPVVTPPITTPPVGMGGLATTGGGDVLLATASGVLLLLVGGVVLTLSRTRRVGR